MARPTSAREIIYRLGKKIGTLPGGDLVRQLAVTTAVKFLYREPWRSMKLIGVTGTNGKTTTTFLIRHLLHDRTPCAALGTLGAVLENGRTLPFKVDAWSTPGPVEMARILRRLSEEGVESVALEVTAAALHYGRVERLTFDTAVLTNLTREHLDIFETFESYREAKLQLVSSVRQGGTLVRNADDPAWETAGRKLDSGRVLTFGINDGSADVVASDIRPADSSTEFTLFTPGGHATVRLPLIGDFNVSNALAACAVAVSQGITGPEIAARLEDAPAVPGRSELISTRPCRVYRDYAHTPDALKSLLIAMRNIAEERIILVFGVGGDRDAGKRPEMGRAAGRLADEILVTSTNPRTEEPESIIDDLVAELTSDQYARIPDRRTAIRTALAEAREGDTVVLAGVGHQDYQEIDGERVPFDESEIVREIAEQSH